MRKILLEIKKIIDESNTNNYDLNLLKKDLVLLKS